MGRHDAKKPKKQRDVLAAPLPLASSQSVPSDPAPLANPYEAARVAAEVLCSLASVERVDVAIVLGSGWSTAAAELGPFTHSFRHADLPGFATPKVASHAGKIHLVTRAGKTIALVDGRVHLYEGHSPHAVVHAVRALVTAGATKVVLTNAAGSLSPDVAPGSVLTIVDHLNLTAASPLEGQDPPAGYGSRFCDLSDLYPQALRAKINHLVDGHGIYAALRGPHYETPAEIRALCTLGADLVGMSTVLEAIAARHLGASVLGLSLVTNFAAGVTKEPLSHEEVVLAGKLAAPRLTSLLAHIFEEL